MKSQKIDGHWITHTNPDGSPGGDRHSTAVVPDSAVIERNAVVLPGVVLEPDSVVRAGDVIVPGGHTIRFDGDSKGKSPLSFLARRALSIITLRG